MSELVYSNELNCSNTLKSRHCCCDNKGLEEDRGTLESGLESSSSTTSSSCEIYHRRSMPTPRKLSVIRETVAIVEPPIEECSASDINYTNPSEILPKINQSQPDLQLILSMPYGSFLGNINIVLYQNGFGFSIRKIFIKRSFK